MQQPRLRKMNQALRGRIACKVIKSVYEARLEKGRKELEKFAQDMVDKYHATWRKMRDDPTIDNKYIMGQQTGNFSYFTAGSESSQTLDYTVLSYCVDKGVEQVNLSTTSRNRVVVTGPNHQKGYYDKVMPVTLNANDVRRLQAIERRIKKVTDSFGAFKSELMSNLNASKTVQDFYKKLPELKSLVGVPELADDAASFALVPQTGTIKSELRKALHAVSSNDAQEQQAA